MRTTILLFFILFSLGLSAQVTTNDTIRSNSEPIVSDTIKGTNEVLEEIKTANTTEKPKFNPTKAGLYSAVLPGLGQYYNRKYWKIPIVWGAIGTGVGVTLYNDKQYKRYREAYIAQLNGLPHEFSDIPGITKEALGRTQDRMKRQRDYSVAITGLVYILNIMDAVVDAHLFDQRNDPDLALSPTVIYDPLAVQGSKAGLSLNFKF